MFCKCFIRLPGTLVPKALCFAADVFLIFLLFSPRNLQAPSADRRETLPHDRSMGALYNASPKIRGALPPKKLGAKNMQNSARFQTTSDFDRNGTRYPKSERGVFTFDSSHIQRKKSDELWSTNYGELYVSLNPPKLHFSGDYISAPRGWWPLKF